MRPQALLALALLPAGSMATSGPDIEARIRHALDEPPPEIQFNDNRVAAGQLENGVLALRLELHRGSWHLLGPDVPGVEVLAFAEENGPPQIPAPMIRVPVGTRIEVTVRNPLDSDLVLHGLTERQVVTMDSLVVPAGAVREVRFTADVEGTYYYWGTTTGASFEGRVYEDSQLSGAFIVDGAEASANTGDRVMVMGLLYDGKDADGEPDSGSEYMVINGRPWPLTERLTYQVGDSVRWRVVNAMPETHPMHLHGFFYRVDARGDFARDTIYWPAQRRMAVTERMAGGTTMSISWSPDRPGGWIFHCHLSWHVTANPATGPERKSAEEREEHLLRGHHAGDPNRHVVEGMGGLTMGIYVEPPEGWTMDEPKRRELRLLIHSDSTAADSRPRFRYVLQDGDLEPASDSIPVLSSTIVLRKGEPTAITAINRTGEATQIHWHGLEIESYFDGVAGVGGYPDRLTPAIAPGDSFETRITPPRAGSYMYHTHVNDIRQQTAGLYGAFIVVEEDQVWDPEVDRIFLISNSREFRVLLNGTSEPEPLTLHSGQMYRLRLMNITVQNSDLHVRLVRDGVPVRWLPVAKDGWDLPAHQRVRTQSDQLVSIGETYDFEFRSNSAVELQLEIRSGGGRLLVAQPIRVVEP
ncbi:MAG: multicopper oxidase domain-containing protein [Gemmatimonadetes bacterium]|nr:multicopper oxidase domain-containing protein [Gemmatimonadota bacterium]